MVSIMLEILLYMGLLLLYVGILTAIYFLVMLIVDDVGERKHPYYKERRE